MGIMASPGTVFVSIPTAVRVSATHLRATPIGLRVPRARAIDVHIVAAVSVAHTGILGATLASGTEPGGWCAVILCISSIRGRAEAVIEVSGHAVRMDRSSVAVVVLDVTGTSSIVSNGRIAGHRCSAGPRKAPCDGCPGARVLDGRRRRGCIGRLHRRIGDRCCGLRQQNGSRRARGDGRLVDVRAGRRGYGLEAI